MNVRDNSIATNTSYKSPPRSGITKLIFLRLRLWWRTRKLRFNFMRMYRR
jgi:hypothetical protein